MSQTTSAASPPSVSRMMFGDDTPRKAFGTALVVGTILVAINHGDLILAGSQPAAWKVVLTYIVPYCVTTWGAITGKRAQWRQDRGSADRPLGEKTDED